MNNRHPRAFAIRFYDSLCRQLVHSEHSNRWFLVDLDDNGDVGWCGCEAHEFNSNNRCSHIKALRRHLAKLFCPGDIKWGFAILNEILQRRKGKV
jgi:hypothetical protein